MAGHQLVHLEHGDLRLAVKHGLELGVRVDEGLLLGILELVLLDVGPQLAGQLGARQWARAPPPREFMGWGERRE